MILVWLIAGASLVVAFVAWGQARRTARRLAQLYEMYWELKYQQGELRVRVQHSSGEVPPSPPQTAAQAQPADSFVPLSELAPQREGVRGGDPAKR